MTAPVGDRVRVTRGHVPAGAVLVDRRTRWGNPFHLDGPAANALAARFGRPSPITRRWAAVRLFACWCADALEREDDQVRAMAAIELASWRHPPPRAEEVVAALGGRAVGCWCGRRQHCHGDVLRFAAAGRPFLDCIAASPEDALARRRPARTKRAFLLRGAGYSTGW